MYKACVALLALTWIPTAVAATEFVDLGTGSPAMIGPFAQAPYDTVPQQALPGCVPMSVEIDGVA